MIVEIETKFACDDSDSELIGDSSFWLRRLSELLGCEQCFVGVSVAVQDLIAERDRMLKTICDLRCRQS